MDIQTIIDFIGTKALELAPQLAGALLVLVLGWIGTGWIVKALKRLFKRTDFDEALETFIVSLTGIALKIILIVIVVGMLGVQTSSLVALLGAMGLAIGLALQGSLSNFAGGVLILVFKPFKVGDLIQTDSGYKGTVQEIQIFNTILVSATKETIVVPNGNLSNNPLVNITGSPEMGIEYTFGIGYEDDIDTAKEIIRTILDENKNILTDAGYKLGVRELADNSVNFYVRATVLADNYWDALFEITETVKKTFDAQGISIPYPQRDVHIIENK